MSFCKWFYNTYKEGIKLVSLFLIGCLGIYTLFLMMTPFLPFFSTGPSWTEYVWWLHLFLYFEVCLLSVLGLIAYFTIVGLYTRYMGDAKGKKITFKVKPRWIVYTVAMIIIFTYIGYNGGYENGESDGFTDGIGEGLQIGMSKSYQLQACPASMSLSLELGIFDFSSTVATDGSVSTETSITDIITIKNTDHVRIAESPTIMLYNPVIDKQGIPDSLRQISVTIEGVELYHEPNIIGLILDDLYPEEDQISLTINITLAMFRPGGFRVVDAGTFQESYTCCLYLYQPNAIYCDVAYFIIIT